MFLVGYDYECFETNVLFRIFEASSSLVPSKLFVENKYYYINSNIVCYFITIRGTLVVSIYHISDRNVTTTSGCDRAVSRTLSY